MKLVVLSRRKAEEFTSDIPWACISIRDPEDDSLPKINRCQLVDCLYLNFHDSIIADSDIKLFNENHADQILDFVLRVWDKIDRLVIHCYAGVARSPAVAAIISKLYYGSDEVYFQEPYKPNKHVYDTLYRVANARPDLPPLW